MSTFQHRIFNSVMIKKREEKEKIEEWANGPEYQQILDAVHKKRNPIIEPKDLPF